MTDFDVRIEMGEYLGKPVAIVRLPGRYRVLSSTIMGGGFAETDTIFILEVKMGYDNCRPEDDLEEVRRRYSLPEDCVGFMTAADVNRVLTVKRDVLNGKKAIVVATAGVTNAVYAGERLPQEIIDLLPKHVAGTINIIAVLDRPVQDCGLAGGIITMTEAKSAALMDMKVKGTGTTSDAVAIACPVGDGDKYCGPATDAGMVMARTVREAVADSIRKWNGNGRGARDFGYRLDELGIGPEEMWEAAHALYIPDPTWETERIKAMFMRHLTVLRKDINVNAMMYAAINMEEMGNRNEMYGLDDGRFLQDPVHLVADELLGIALAEYVAGTKGLFEYVRYDKKKPGILGTLGPFLDDIVASLIGSIMSRIYTELLEGEDKLGS
ncbi:MAG: adenosylcobinamide amidohydrolase [Methanomassiliicoccus sp.]|nr:adenosylcobinamide amidohydrolase [Methanomassiliicoccus sp.]